jgi:8-oxo-dGTP diphosphatase
MSDRITPEKQGFSLVVDIVLIAPDNTSHDNVLLVQRRWDPFEGCWATPGGYVETDQHETALEAAYRELLEETTIDLRALGVSLRQVGFYDTQGRDPRGDVRTAAFVARLSTMVPAVGQDDAAKAEWLPVDDLPPLAFDHTVILADALNTLVDVAR